MRHAPKVRAIIRLAAIPSALAVTALIAWRLGFFDLGRREQVIALIRHAEGTRSAAPLYVLSFAAVVALCLPATAFAILGGALFGPIKGLVLAWSGAMIGTAAAHTMSRTIARRAVQRLFGRNKLVERLRDRADVRTLIRLRVLPVAPFGVLDHVAGLAGVPLRTLLLATAIGIVPGTAAYAFAGTEFRAGLERSGPEAKRALLVASLVTIAMSGLAIAPSVAGFVRRRRS